MMLKEKQVVLAKTKLDHIRRGTESLPIAAADRIHQMWWELEQMGMEKPEYMGFLLNFRENVHVRDSARKILTELLEQAGMGSCFYLMGSFLRAKSSEMVLRDSFWMECMPHWKEGRGCYGANPGEDMLIKIIACGV